MLSKEQVFPFFDALDGTSQIRLREYAHAMVKQFGVSYTIAHSWLLLWVDDQLGD